MRKFLLLLALVTITIPASAQSTSACSVLQAIRLDGVDMQITAAVHYTDKRLPPGRGGPGMTLPPHCHMEGEIDRRTGADGNSYALRFAVNLPDDWNGRYLFQGGGGLNGILAEPIGTVAAGITPALHRGFAVVSTDSGHQAQGPFDAGFMADQEAVLNFQFLGNPRVTRVTKRLVEHYYGNAIETSYFTGCSTGGREGMIMAQRYPLLYDGIISGAPAMRTGFSNLGLRWLNVNLSRVAPRDAGGTPQLAGVFFDAERKLIIDGLLKTCDALDGVEDGLVYNVKDCDFDVRTLACEAGQTGDCLDSAKAEALATGLAGPVDSRGVQVYSPFVVDTGLDDRAGLPGLLVRGGTPPEGPETAGKLTLDVDTQAVDVAAFHNALGNSTSFRLSTFIANGGKQIFYHGMSDPWFSAMDTVWYYDQMAEANGGSAAASGFSRLFLVPGMLHCAGGDHTLDRFDMLSALVDWVEHGKAPERIKATGDSLPGVSRPLCPYPQHTHYQGSGGINDAASFECRE